MENQTYYAMCHGYDEFYRTAYPTHEHLIKYCVALVYFGENGLDALRVVDDKHELIVSIRKYARMSGQKDIIVILNNKLSAHSTLLVDYLGGDDVIHKVQVDCSDKTMISECFKMCFCETDKK